MPVELETFREIDSLPTECKHWWYGVDERRTCTDKFCIFFGIAFTVVMVILAIALFNYGNPSHNTGNFYKVNFPSDS